MGAFNIMPREQQEKKIKMKFCILFSLSILKAIELNRQQYLFSGYCNEHGTIYAISSDFGDRMTIQHLD